MKTLIFICLKLAELIGGIIALGLLTGLIYLLGKWDILRVLQGRAIGFGDIIGAGLVHFCLVIAILIALAVITYGISELIKSNLKLTDKIYNKYFKK